MVDARVQECWNEQWQQSGNKLLAVKTKAGRWKKEKLSREEQVKVNRLRVGHCQATHGYLMEEIQQGLPGCPVCNTSVLTVRHVLTECGTLSVKRQQYLKHGIRKWKRYWEREGLRQSYGGTLKR